MISEEPDKLRLALRRRAMDLLARREHTRHELSNKLSAAIKKSQQRVASRDTEGSGEYSGQGHADQGKTQEYFDEDQLEEDQLEGDQRSGQQHQNQQLLTELISEVLDKLEQDKLLSDSRFTESYVNGRMNRGYGPLYIRHQLRQKQVDGTLLENNLAQLDQQQWIEQLRALIKRRVSDAGLPERGSKEYLKLQRFILSRGFTASQWYEVEKRFKSP